MRKILTCALCLCIFLCAQGQKGVTQLKPITEADFHVSSPVVDSNANAVILADIGSTAFEGNNSGFFTIIFKQRKRILLKSRNSFDEATVKIPIYRGRSYETEERLEDFEATTYNLENGRVVATKLDKASLFYEKVTRDYGERKFTFPNIKEGSIIEYQYTVKSPFQYFNIRPWTFQHEHPVLWSEFAVEIPYMFHYLVSRKGYLPYTVDTAWKAYKHYTVVESGGTSTSNRVYSISGDAVNEKWIMKNVPAFKSEIYTSSSSNHRNAIDFQLLRIQYSEANVQQMLKDWYTTVKELMKDPDFGLQLSDENNWIKEAINPIANSTDERLNAKKIFAWVRDNIKCNDHDARWLSQPLRKTMQSKTGNVCDINLLLTAIYTKMGYEAAPVLLSTRGHGYPRETSSSLSQFNYVISRVKLGENYVLLDASQDDIGFGNLPEECYNISGRLVDEIMPKLIPLSADSLVESSVASTIIYNDEKEGLMGGMNTRLGAIESTRLRAKMKGKKTEEYLKDLKKEVSQDIELSNLQIDSLQVLDEPLMVSFDMKFKWNDEDVIYFNPMLGKGWGRNPFASAQRLYPVEMPYRINETYTLNMEVPKGYKVDEVPKGTRAVLNGNEGLFEYLFAVSGNNIQFRSRLQLNKATFMPEDYETLRDFFAMVVKKQQEQIVFKKDSK